ncbi:MAG: hypothetical protein GX133_05270 [Syntrophomonadaceae bacterium]|nr:hypothetical protein [Syntrophomonadaceae bacterium]
MITMPLYLVFLHAIPETVILICLGALLIGLKLPWQRVLLVAALTSLASYFVRILPLTPGINVFLQLPILIGLLAYFCSLPLTYATAASFLGLISLGVSETIYNISITALTGISVQQALANPLWRTLYPLPNFMLMGLIIIALIRYNVVVYDIREAFGEKMLDSEEEQFI